MTATFTELLTGSGPSQPLAALLLLLGGLAFLVCAAALSLIDIREHRLPNRILYPWAGVTAGILVIVGLLMDDFSGIMRSFSAGVLWGGAFLVIRLMHPPSLGMGDVKLVVILGIYAGFMGWEVFLTAVVLSFLLGGLTAVVMLLSRRARPSTSIPFGPFLLAGTGMALLLS